ncbi:MAG: PAS domain S-box protein [Cyclobacteriaceae bacterium]|nr:PAS domain S-box protein [Cyclobacteriaceae bacterium]
MFIKISSKITGLVIIVIVITVLAISYLSYNLSKSFVERKHEESLSFIAKNRADQIKLFFDQSNSVISLLQQSLPVVLMNNTVDTLSGNADQQVKDFLQKIKKLNDFKSVHILDGGGRLIHSSEVVNRFSSLDTELPRESLNQIYFGEIQQETQTLFCGAPLETNEGKKVIVIEIKMGEIYQILNDTTGLGNTGEVIIAKQAGNDIHFLAPFRGDSLVYEPIPYDSSAHAIFIKRALQGQNGSRISIDNKGVEVLAIWRYIPNVKWGLVAKMNTAEIGSISQQLFSKFVLFGLVIIVLSSLLFITFSKFLIAPLLDLKSTLQLLGNGTLPDQVVQKSNDEIGLMARTLNSLVQTLKKTADFAKKIGEGKFDTAFQSMSKEDTLGQSLISMRDNLVKADLQDKERNWIISGMADVGAILRIHDNIQTLGDEVLKYVIEKVDAVQGALYVTEDDQVEEKAVELKSLYAYNRRKFDEKRFNFAEGLVGQCVAEKQMIMRTEVPPNYVSITSGLLGDQKPTCILIIPLIAEEKVYGVLEIAGLVKFEERQINFIKDVGVILARTIFNIKVNDRTRKLLEESQTMSEELREKQEVLRQNAEEMQATQEELERSNLKLEEQIEEVNRTQNRMQLLLENASEVITIYEESGSIRYISPSVEPILGYSQKEMIGTSDKEKVSPSMQEDFENMFVQLKENPNEQINIQYKYKTKEGNYIWLESTGTNFMSNKAIHGIIVNSRDITERRRAEQEQRMRSKMQALSENSPDLITRLENNKISYINPVIESYTGNKPVAYINQKLNEIDLKKGIIDSWLSIVEEVNNNNDTVATEMDFPTNDGDRIMQVNAIPEYDESKNLESVLVVSHDITERKIIELEIKNKNKKIADSINYAKRIQNAILPNNAVIHHTLPKSFILYKPKDIVSGDFPWFAHVGKHLYMAAVDCTGHGVPGALLSLIGYFLLNDIVRSRKVSDPGIILDQLDEGVTQTLRQDQADNSAKDGMDIAICRIDLENNEVAFAGAHRPLYVMKDGEMMEIKGNKFAIGGGIYKNQTNFTCHTINLNEGDSFYFCSDGFPDQFGGPDIKKYGPRRLRELVVEHHYKEMNEVYQAFDESWETWKGDEKQMDDVLLIGIKF